MQVSNAGIAELDQPRKLFPSSWRWYASYSIILKDTTSMGWESHIELFTAEEPEDRLWTVKIMELIKAWKSRVGLLLLVVCSFANLIVRLKTLGSYVLSSSFSKSSMWEHLSSEIFFRDFKSTNSPAVSLGKTSKGGMLSVPLLRLTHIPCIYFYNFSDVTFSNSVMVNSWLNQIAGFNYASILNYFGSLMFNVMTYMR